jgi:cold shock CspA family protein
MAVAQKLRGTIKTIKKAEGYGFITHQETGIDHFFHRTAIERGSSRKFEDLEVADPVEFTASDGTKGPRAVDVRFAV